MYGFRERSKKFLQVLVYYFLVNPFLFGQTDSSDSTSALNNKQLGLSPHISSHHFNVGNIHTLGPAIQSLEPGLWAPQSSADPNLQNNSRIRGLTSLGYSTFENVNPAVSLVGFKGLSIQDIDPFFIDQVAIVKDGSLAQYGIQGGLGAIELQPVQGKGKNQIIFRSFLSSEMEIDNDPTLSASEFRRFSSPDEGANTDWREEIGQNGHSWVNQLAIMGEAKKTDYYLGISHRNLNGIQRHTGFDQMNGFLNLGTSLLKDRLSIRTIGMHSRTERNLGYASVYEFADRFNPTAPVRLTSGEYNQPQRFNYFNPVAIIDENSRETEETRSFGQLMADLSLGAWTWKNQAGVFRESAAGVYTSTGLSSFSEFFLGANSTSEREVSSFQSQIQHKTQFGNTLLQTSVGIESQHFSRSNSTENQFLEGANSSFEKHEIDLLAYFAHVDVVSGNLKGQFVYRREGSSALSTNHQWSNYFFTSIGYNLSGLKSFSLFEIFTSFGTAGMTPFQSGMTKRLVEQFDFPNPPIIYQNATDDLGQMSSSHFDLGLNIMPNKGAWLASFNFFTNRVNNFWYRNFDDATLDFNTWMNSGELRTTGLEVVAETYQKLGNIDWTIRGVISTQNTRIEDAGLMEGFTLTRPGFGCGSGTIHRIQSGDDLGNIYGPRFTGFTGAGQGSLNFETEDVDGNGFIDDNDFQVIGNALPDWTLGLQQQFEWKRITVAMNFRGMFGHDVVNFRSLHGGPINSDFNVRSSRIATDLQFVEQFNQWNSYFVENGSFLRLQMITFRYHVPLKAHWVKDLNVYFTGNNLLTLTGYDGNPELQLTNHSNLDGALGTWQSEFQWTPGIDRHDAWPHSRSITLGLNATF